MGIQLHHNKTDDLVGFIAVCDMCDKRVMADEANVVFVTHPEMERCLWYLFCRPCDNVFKAKARKQGVNTQWQPLTDAIGFLAINTKAKLKECVAGAKRAMAMSA